MPFDDLFRPAGQSADSGLVDACRRGNLDAFERLYQDHGSRLKSMAYHLLGSRADAEDAVQETFLKVYRGVEKFESESAIGTWIYRILINTCYDLGRKKQRQVRTVIADPPIRDAAHTNVPLKLALEQALGEINEQHRMVFLLFAVEGLKHSEIAAVLSIPEGTSKAWLFEAKKHLKRLLMESKRDVRM